MTDKGSLIVLSAPSGTGKGAILNEFTQKYFDDKIIFSVSATTRNPRPGEVHGVNYYFISKDEFKSKAASGGFLEYAEFCDNMYGTPRDAVMSALDSGIDVILEIETVGARKVKENYPLAVMVFVLPPSLDELKNRLVGRGTETEDSLKKRLETATMELELAPDYDYIIVNDIVEDAAKELNYIIKSQRLKTINNKKTISEVLKNDLSRN